MATQADGGFEVHRKSTRRDVFLAEMDKVVPWSELGAAIEPFCPKIRPENGRRPVGLERMLCIHFLVAMVCAERFGCRGSAIRLSVDATILGAASSTKNPEKARNSEMHQTKKGNDRRKLAGLGFWTVKVAVLVTGIGRIGAVVKRHH